MGGTALMIACYEGHTTIATQLLNAGADTNQGNDMGRTALMCACRRSNATIVRILLQAGADTNQADNNGWMPLFIAYKSVKKNQVGSPAHNRRDTIISMLLRSGVQQFNFYDVVENVGFMDSSMLKTLTSTQPADYSALAIALQSYRKQSCRRKLQCTDLIDLPKHVIRIIHESLGYLSFL